MTDFYAYADTHVLRADALGSPQHHYFACPDCGWCSPLRQSRTAVVLDGEQHLLVKAATKDEQR